ncbi:6-hydroxymethylpterin diphosphokinase MptE-like protein [Breznakiellaceae bacterium SP9]
MESNNTEDYPQAVSAHRGLSVLYQGKALLSLLDPIAQGERLAQSVGKSAGTLYLALSPLYGYGLQTILDNLPPDSAILAVEFDPQLYQFSLSHLDPPLLHDSRLLFVGKNSPAQCCALIEQRWGKRHFRKIEVVKLSSGWRVLTDVYTHLAQVLEENIVLEWSNAMTIIKLGRSYSRNTLRNLGMLANCPSVDLFSAGRIGRLNKSVLVLGAGPSLDAALEHFTLDSDLRQRFLIFCVDTCLPSLFERRIKPDLIVALECQHWNLRDFIGVSEWDVSIAMDLSSLSSVQHLFAHQSPKYLFASLWAPLRIFDRLKAAGLFPLSIPPLGSVGLCATALALRLTSGTVFTAGLDFSFTLDRFHARSSPSHLRVLSQQNRFKRILNPDPAFRKDAFRSTAKNGAAVYSNYSLNIYRNLFTQEFANAQYQGRLYDIESSGLDLGLSAVSAKEAVRVLTSETDQRSETQASDCGAAFPPDSAAVKHFIDNEKKMLLSLREHLTGNLSSESLPALLHYCDYLWNFFPECAGKDTAELPPLDSSFLNRVRVHIDYFLKDFEVAVSNCTPYRQFYF